MLAKYEELNKQQLAEIPSSINAADFTNLDEEIEELKKAQEKMFIEYLGKEHVEKAMKEFYCRPTFDD